MKILRFYRFFRNFSRNMKKRNLSAFASSTAFFIFLSIVPLLILICTILPYTSLTEANLVGAFQDFVPKAVMPLIEGIVSNVYSKSAGVMSVALLATLWSAARGVLALMRGLNVVYGKEEERNILVIRGIASFYTAIFLIAVLLSLFLNVFGTKLVEVILHRFPSLQSLVSFLMHFRFMAVWVILTFIFAAIYTYLPNVKLKYRGQLPGAAFSAVVWSVYSWGFSLYVNYGVNFGIYGSLSIIIIVLLWLYFCSYIVLIGAYINQYFEGTILEKLDIEE